MRKKQKHVTIASFNYLNEISAFPLKIRKEYIAKLSERKYSENRTSTMVLKTIYSYVDENKINKWDTDEVCVTLGININILHIHKSRLLRGLREYYLKWKIIEKEIEPNSSHEKKSVHYRLKKALKMFDIGMVRESKNIILSVKKELEMEMADLKYKYFTLSLVYEKLMIYYFAESNARKIAYYLRRIEDNSKDIKLLEINLTKEERILVSVRLNYCRFCMDYYKWFKKLQVLPLLHSHLSKVFRCASAIGEKEYMLKTMYNLATIDYTLGNQQKTKEHCLKGYELAVRLKAKPAQYTFAAMLYVIKTFLNEKPPKSALKKIIENYYKLKKEYPLNHWTNYLENTCVSTYYPEKNREILDIFYERINSNFLKRNISFAVYWRFTLNSELYKNNILSRFKENITEDGYIQLNKIEHNKLEDIENTCINTLCYHKELNAMGFIWDVYMLQLQALFFREDDFDYDRAMLIANKMEWLKRNKKRKVLSAATFALLKLGLRMFKHSDNEKYMLGKYEYKLKKAIDNFKKNPSELSIIDYAIVSSLARRLKCKSITNLVVEFYKWLQTHHAEILAPVLREIEEKKAKVYTVEGSEEAA